MYRDVWRQVYREASGGLAHDVMTGITRFHRIQVTPGIRAACEYAAGKLREYGLAAQIVEYPATGQASYWSAVVPQAWEIESAEAWLIDPEGGRERLASFDEEPTSVIQRSACTPEGGLEGPVVLVDNADRPESYEDIDVEGKWVLTEANADQVARLAVKSHGALGIIYYGMRLFAPVRSHPMDVADARQYTAFRNVLKESDVVGFVLSPRKGRELARRISAEHAGTFSIHGSVRARFFDGVTENVEALIPGETDEEVVVVAHICHPKPSANDNASGAGALMEAARVLNRLIDDEVLPRPARAIRFLLVPEMTGSYTFLSGIGDRAERIVTGINLDMVGADQDLVGSTLQAESPPAATPSLARPLLSVLLDEVSGAATNPSGTDQVPVMRTRLTSFSGGSDHVIFSDPSVGIPMPMLINWPDKYYHTSLDTPEKVSPDMLRRVAAMTATYAYWFASAGDREALWLGQRLKSCAVESIQSVFDEAQELLLADEQPEESSLTWLGRRAAFVLNRRLADMASVRRLVLQGEVQRVEPLLDMWRKQVLTAYADQLDALTACADAMSTELPDTWELPEDPDDLDHLVSAEPSGEWEEEAARMVARRVHPGPVDMRGALAQLSAEDREGFTAFRDEFSKKAGSFLGAAHFALLLGYYLDGRRTLLQATRLVELDCGRADMQYAVESVRWLEKMNLVEIH